VRPRSRLAHLAVVVAIAATSVSGALAGGGVDELRNRIAGEKQREGVLTTEIAAASAAIRDSEAELRLVSAKLARIEADLAAKRARLAALTALYARQTRRLALLRSDYAIAERQLENRLVELYQTDQPDFVSIVFQATSLDDLVDQLELFADIGRQDREIAESISSARDALRVTRRATAVTRARTAAVAKALEARAVEEREARDAVEARRASLVAARGTKGALLAAVRAERHQDEEDLGDMLAESARIAKQLQAARAHGQDALEVVPAASRAPDTTPSPRGLVWPVQGVVTSGLGWRCLGGLCRMHEGLDIAALPGTPIRAAAAGTVVYAGWAEGYGNLVVIDHGGGLATAYGHQSAIYVTGGPVSQGQVIGAVGSTGHSTGPHVHFEVRVNGEPVDPLRYL
jgi:murein DD-endopeptidase MepM/ murein hydrolase activator NlpD